MTTGSLLTDVIDENNDGVYNEEDTAINMGKLVKDPTGYIDRSECTMTFDDGTRTFTITPVAASYSFRVLGYKITKSVPEELIISTDNGQHFIYFDINGDLVDDIAPPANDLLYGVVFTAIVYWNNTQSKGRLLEERHGKDISYATHRYLHFNEKCRHTFGGSISSFTIGGGGSVDSDAQVSMLGGTFTDEDLEHNVVDSATPTNPFEQVLSPQAKMPAIYRDGASGIWTWDTATNFPLKQGATRPVYNQFTGGSWQTTEVSNNNFFAVWIWFVNDMDEPYVSMLGQIEDTNLAAAQSNNTRESLDLGDFITPESHLLYRLIFKTSNSMVNSVKADLVDVEEYLGQQVTSSPVPNPVYQSLKEFSTSETVAVSGEILLPSSVSGFGRMMAGDNEEFADFIFDSSGVVTLISSSNNVAITDTASTISIYTAIANQVGIKNNLAASKTVKLWVRYS